MVFILKYINERDYLNLHKVDHIKKIDLALNFEVKPITYTDHYRFTDKKNIELIILMMNIIIKNLL